MSPNVAPEAWVFPSERGPTPLGKDNCWRRHFEPRLRKVRLEWANFQVFRRTYSSLSRHRGIDPKTVADQCGHGLGVNLDVYTRVSLEDRYEAVSKLEKAVLVN